MEAERHAALLLERWRETDAPFDRILAQYLKEHREIGSRARRELTDAAWEAVRHKARREWDEAHPGEAPPPHVTAECPEWLFPLIPEPDLLAMQEEAPLDLRVNTLKMPRDKALSRLKKEGIAAVPTPLSPVGLRLEKRTPLASLKLYKDGAVEVQDEGSQLAALFTQAAPGMEALDFCAGGGGKTLAMGAMMRGTGRIAAYDALLPRLENLRGRAERAGILAMLEMRLPYDNERFDLVLLDVPCSGTGTGRRAPDARWKLTPEKLAALVRTQAEILGKAPQYLKPGGAIVYVTCSLLAAENEEQIDRFLKTHPEFSCPARRRLSPATDHTDGFFMARLTPGEGDHLENSSASSAF